MRAVICTLAVLGLLVETAAADEARIFLLGSPTVQIRPAFVAALRIQLADLGAIEESLSLAEPTRPAQIARAAQLVDQTQAVMAIWMERASTTELVVLAVSRHREGALVQPVTLPVATESEIDRLVALKIGELVERGLALPANDRIVESQPQLPRPQSDSRLAYFLELGLDGSLGAGSTGSQTGLRAAVGVQLERSVIELETMATMRTGSELETESPQGRVTIDEFDATVGARIFARRSRLAVGAHMEAGIRRLDVVGVAPDGRMGATTSLVPMVSVGLDGRWRIARTFELRGAVGTLITLQRPVFALDGMLSADIGQLRPVAVLSVVIVMP